jgi:Flp pilus assembly protein TadG
MKLTNRQRGQSTLEFALVAPLFFFLVCIIMEFGILLFDYLSVNEIARELARTLAVGSYDITVLVNANDRFAKMNEVHVQIRVSNDMDDKTLENIEGCLGRITKAGVSVSRDAAVAAGTIAVIVTAKPRVNLALLSRFIPDEFSSGTVALRMEN